MHCNVWHDKNLCSINLCDRCLTRIVCTNKNSHGKMSLYGSFFFKVIEYRLITCFARNGTSMMCFPALCVSKIQLGQTKLIFCFSDFSIEIMTWQAGIIKLKIN